MSIFLADNRQSSYFRCETCSYAHGYLFPAAVETIRHENISELPIPELAVRGGKAWASSYSTVSKFGARYTPPISGITVAQEVEALVEGSELSLLMRRATVRNGDRSSNSEPWDVSTVDKLYKQRPTRAQRFRNDPAERGGTAIVHYIKRPEWFLETALALLGSLSVGDRFPGSGTLPVPLEERNDL